jgi:hypothetical protein
MSQASLFQVLIDFLQKNSSDYSNVSNLKKLPKQTLDSLGINSKSQIGEIVKKVTPYLGNGLVILKGSKSSFLAYNIPKNRILYNYIQKHPGKSPGQIAPNLPMVKGDFIQELYSLIESGGVKITYTEKYTTKLFAQVHKPEKTISSTLSKKPDSDTIFKIAFDELNKGEKYVRICDIRRKLDWSREEFDSTLKKLRDNSTIQLHEGITSTMDESEVRDSFVDENNFLHINISWRET